MDQRIERIRDEERQYHEACYEQYSLFEQGTWLHKPVKTVMDTLAYFDTPNTLHVLDLGCGVGRNSIPIAETLSTRGGSVVCVDLIESALTKLMSYSREHRVSDYIQPVLSDIGKFDIVEQAFDYIVAVSALEHVESQSQLTDVVSRMVRGTKAGGINCIIINSNIEEIDQLTEASLEPMIELNLTTEQMKQLLTVAYTGWEVVYTTVKPLEFHIERQGRAITLKSDCITYVVRR